MRIEKQFNVFLENKPGRLSRICTALAKEKVSIQALTVMDSKEHGVLRLVVDHVDETRAVLNSMGAPFSESDVLMLEIKHQPGALANLCESLAAEHVNIDYMYSSAGAKNGKANAVLKATPTEKVKQVLNAAPAKPGRQSRRTVRRPPVRR